MNRVAAWSNSRVRASLISVGRLAVLTGVTVALAFAVGSPAAARTATHLKIPPGRFALGDSVMLGAKYKLKALGFGGVDAVESRQAYSGPSELRHRGGALPENVVVHLGTNGTFPLSTCKAIVRAVGPERHLFLLTVHVDRSWTRGNNKVIRECAADYPPGRVAVIDWDWAASRHPSWLYPDHTHLTPAGAKGYARMIDAAIDRSEASISQRAV